MTITRYTPEPLVAPPAVGKTSSSAAAPERPRGNSGAPAVERPAAPPRPVSMGSSGSQNTGYVPTSGIDTGAGTQPGESAPTNLLGLGLTNSYAAVAPSDRGQQQQQLGTYLQSQYPTYNQAPRVLGQSGASTPGAGTPTEGQIGFDEGRTWGVWQDGVESLSGAETAARDASAEPQMDASAGAIGYSQVRTADQETLFGVGGPTVEDIEQRDDGTAGNGDCALLSALGAVVDHDPQAIQDMIQQTGPNSYAVTLNFEGKPETYNVDDAFPVDKNGQPTGAQITLDPQSGKAILWPALVEKAYAKYQDAHPGVLDWAGKQGYTALNAGGSGADALAALTGMQVYQTDPRSASNSDVQTLLGLAEQGVPVTVLTGLTSNDTQLPSGLQPGHLYSVASTWTSSSGEPMVTLRNPWGEDPNQDSANEPGYISVPVRAIQRDCRGINAGNAQEA